MARKKLSAVLFDIDDTLFSTSEFAALARRNAVEAMIRVGVRLPAEDLMKELLETISEFSTNYEHHFDKLLCRIPPQVYAGVNPAIIVAAGVVAYHDTKFRQLAPFNDVAEVLGALAGTALVRGIITSGMMTKQAEKLIRLNLYQYLSPQAIFISDQIGIAKPNPKLYLRACDDLRLSPGEVLYVGDNPLHDIDPANQVGMITVLNRRSGKYRDVEGRTRPAYEIANFFDLKKILRDKFGIKVA
ncbi:MAG: HAD-IA family hydrolase [Planctomycetes bacterium]|nr:HAD-IA family hydrolase [Planctomycetota bacterium]